MDDDAQFMRRLKEAEKLLGLSLCLIDLPFEEEETLPERLHPHQGASLLHEPAASSEVTSNQQAEDLAIPKDEVYNDNSPYQGLQIGDLVDKSTLFCPWRVALSYPERFIGKTNRPRARPYFEAILQMRDWDFFQIRDRLKPNKAFLLVPTEQFTTFLEIVNRRLNTELCIPYGVNAKHFSLSFGLCGTLRPKYLQRTISALENEPTKKTYAFDTTDESTWAKAEDSSDDGWETLSWRGAEQYLNNMKMLKSCKSAVDKLNAEDRAKKRQEYREKKMKDLKKYLDFSSAATDAVLVSVDVEAVETQPGCISEIGIAILDTSGVVGVAPGLNGSSWWPLISAHHLRVKEFSGLINYRYVQGCPDKFDFGESTFPAREEICEAIKVVLSPYVDSNRRVVLVGHDVGQDISYLDKLGFDMKQETNLVRKLDSQVLHQAWRESDSKRSLGAVLNDLDISYSHLHNAGNDAVYTLRAVIGIAFAATPEEHKGL